MFREEVGSCGPWTVGPQPAPMAESALAVPYQGTALWF